MAATTDNTNEFDKSVVEPYLVTKVKNIMNSNQNDIHSLQLGSFHSLIKNRHITTLFSTAIHPHMFEKSTINRISDMLM